jgi:hypothetical protein
VSAIRRGSSFTSTAFSDAPVAIDRLKTSFWVQAQIRLCDLAAIPIAIMKRGDPDAGTVILKIARRERTCEVLSQVRDMDGEMKWMRLSGPNPVPESDADPLIERQTKRDPDLWVIEIEDPHNRYQIDAPVL